LVHAEAQRRRGVAGAASSRAANGGSIGGWRFGVVSLARDGPAGGPLCASAPLREQTFFFASSRLRVNQFFFFLSWGLRAPRPIRRTLSYIGPNRYRSPMISLTTCHPREGGDPSPALAAWKVQELGSRLRGNDGECGRRAPPSRCGGAPVASASRPRRLPVISPSPTRRTGVALPSLSCRAGVASPSRARLAPVASPGPAAQNRASASMFSTFARP
jgi:hypothetical protein